MADERAAVVLDDRRQVRSSELAVCDPARELVVPDTVMSAEELAVRFRKVRNLVAAREGESSPRWLGSILAGS